MSSEPTPSIEPGVSPVYPSPAGDVNDLAARVAALETRFSPNSWVFGTNFLKRAFAMWAHVFAAQFILAIVIGFVVFACTVIFGLSIAGLSNR